MLRAESQQVCMNVFHASWVLPYSGRGGETSFLWGLCSLTLHPAPCFCRSTCNLRLWAALQSNGRLNTRIGRGLDTFESSSRFLYRRYVYLPQYFRCFRCPRFRRALPKICRPLSELSIRDK